MKKRDTEIVDHISPERYHLLYTSTQFPNIYGDKMFFVTIAAKSYLAKSCEGMSKNI